MEVTTLDGTPVIPEELTITWDLEAAQKGGFEDFMSKEIHEQPDAVADTLLGRRGPDGELILDELRLERRTSCAASTRCSSWPADRATTPRWWPSTPSSTGSSCPTEVDIASEFRYRDPVLTSARSAWG